jgi:hypothetical protein
VTCSPLSVLGFGGVRPPRGRTCARFAEEQIIGALKEHAAGLLPAELCRKHCIREATFYKWRSRYGGMESPTPAIVRWLALRKVVGWRN